MSKNISVARATRIKAVSLPSHADVAPAMKVAIGTPFGSIRMQEIDERGTFGLVLSRDGKTGEVAAVIPANSKRLALSLWSMATVLAIRKNIPWWRRAWHRIVRFVRPRTPPIPAVVPPPSPPATT